MGPLGALPETSQLYMQGVLLLACLPSISHREHLPPFSAHCLPIQSDKSSGGAEGLPHCSQSLGSMHFAAPICHRQLTQFTLWLVQSTYTGVYARGGPTNVEPSKDLSSLLDRSPADIRGNKLGLKDQNDPPLTARMRLPPQSPLSSMSLPGSPALRAVTPAASPAPSFSVCKQLVFYTCVRDRCVTLHGLRGHDLYTLPPLHLEALAGSQWHLLQGLGLGVTSGSPMEPERNS